MVRPAMLPEGFGGKGRDCPPVIVFLIIFVSFSFFDE
jgi:hypothetical protein